MMCVTGIFLFPFCGFFPGIGTRVVDSKKVLKYISLVQGTRYIFSNHLFIRWFLW